MSERRDDHGVMPRWLPRFNRAVVNPIQRLYAPYVPPLALLVHTGRRSGRERTTPVLCFRRAGGFAIPLPYGRKTDWVRNVLAAGGARLRRRGRTHDVTNPRLVEDEDELPKVLRPVWPRIDVLLVDRVGGAEE